MRETLRADRWLWFARFFKSRTLAAEACSKRRIRLNGKVLSKSNQPLRTGDVLTFSQGDAVRVVRLTALGTRRGPADEAHTLYEDLAPQPQRPGTILLPDVPRKPGTGRPSKSDRRLIERLRGRK